MAVAIGGLIVSVLCVFVVCDCKIVKRDENMEERLAAPTWNLLYKHFCRKFLNILF